jgi:rRNA-processing protein FCF1
LAQASSARPPYSRARPAPARKKVVAFDSSFLLAIMETPTAWNEDILESVGSFTPVVLMSVLDELSRLAAKGDKKGGFAALALELLKQGRFSLEPDGRGKPDDEIISFALREGAGVATIDADLIQRLRASRVQMVITLRGGRISA